jgi:aminopeptidase N
MNGRPFLIAIPLFITIGLSAKNPETCSHSRQKQKIAAIPDFPKRPYDIFLYRLTLDLRNAFAVKKPIYSGTAEIHMNTTDLTEVIEFDAQNQTMTRVTLDGQELFPTPQPEGGVLTILLPPSLQASGTHLTFVIDFERSSDGRTFLSERAFRRARTETCRGLHLCRRRCFLYDERAL